MTHRIFIGVDTRQPIAYHVLCQSIMNHMSEPVSITPLWNVYDQVGVRQGLTQFTYSRYLVPHLCNYEGKALFMDADMLVMQDLAPWFHVKLRSGVAVANVTRRFERVSAMLFNNEKCRKLTPDYINTQTPQEIEDWSEDGVGILPAHFNLTIPYDPEPAEPPVIVHYTQGIPCFDETRDCAYSDEWNETLNQVISTVEWEDIMGSSVHKKEMGIAV